MNKGEVPKVAKFYIDFFVEYANGDHSAIPLQLSRCNDPVWIEAGKCFKLLNSTFCNFQSYTFVQLISQNSLNLSQLRLCNGLQRAFKGVFHDPLFHLSTLHQTFWDCYTNWNLKVHNKYVPTDSCKFNPFPAISADSFNL